MISMDNMDKAAKILLVAAENTTPVEVLNLFGNNVNIRIPISDELDHIKVDDPCADLSVRCVNSLKRASIWTMGSLASQLGAGLDLHSLRNLGKKSISEIQFAIFTLSYNRLTTEEKLRFWHDVIQLNIPA